MNPNIDLYISRSSAVHAAMRAVRAGKATTVEINHIQLEDQQGYTVELFDIEGNSAGLLPEPEAHRAVLKWPEVRWAA